MKPCVHCGAGIDAPHALNCVVMVAQRGMPFTAVNKVIMRGSEFVARARSHNMALRIANALNVYVPNKGGF